MIDWRSGAAGVGNAGAPRFAAYRAAGEVIAQLVLSLDPDRKDFAAVAESVLAAEAAFTLKRHEARDVLEREMELKTVPPLAATASSARSMSSTSM